MHEDSRLAQWAQQPYECFERQLARPEVGWRFDWSHFDDKYSSAVESYMGLDETLADQARDRPGQVELHNTNGKRVTAEGDSKSGYYVEAVAEKVEVARFSDQAVDHVTLTPDGNCEWMHVDRTNQARSFQLLFQVDPSRLEVESLAGPPSTAGVEVRDGAEVVGGSTLRTCNSS